MRPDFDSGGLFVGDDISDDSGWGRSTAAGETVAGDSGKTDQGGRRIWSAGQPQDPVPGARAFRP